MLESVGNRLGLRGRFSQLDPAAGMALTLGSLYFAGGAIGTLSLVLPHPEEFHETALWTNIGLAFGTGTVLIALHRAFRTWMVQIAVLAGTVVITRAVYFGVDPSGFYTFWYLWIGVFAFFYFGRRWGAVHMAAVGIGYGWALTTLDSTSPVSRWVVTIGSIAVVGILVDRLAERLREQTAASANRASNLEAVGEVARQLATQSDSRAVGWAICTASLKATGASIAVLWRTTAAGDGLEAAAAAGADVEHLHLPFMTPNSGAVQAFTSAEARFQDLDAGDGSQELLPDHESGAAHWEPVLTDNAVVGVLAVYWSETRVDVDDELRKAMQLLALEASIAIERGELLGRLELAARTDDLTGLHNRRAWSSELGRELGRAKREELPLCVAVLDLDRFKEFNDAHGHQAGDRFLKQVAGVWSMTLRGTDILARHGGEEFALAMPNTDLASAEAMLERLCSAMPDGETCSAGVCVWDANEGPEELLARADSALYRAKAAGRNRIVAS